MAAYLIVVFHLFQLFNALWLSVMCLSLPDEDDERDVTVADAGDAGCLHSVIPGCQMLPDWFFTAFTLSVKAVKNHLTNIVLMMFASQMSGCQVCICNLQCKSEFQENFNIQYQTCNSIVVYNYYSHHHHLATLLRGLVM